MKPIEPGRSGGRRSATEEALIHLGIIATIPVAWQMLELLRGEAELAPLVTALMLTGSVVGAASQLVRAIRARSFWIGSLSVAELLAGLTASWFLLFLWGMARRS